MQLLVSYTKLVGVVREQSLTTQYTEQAGNIYIFCTTAQGHTLTAIVDQSSADADDARLSLLPTSTNLTPGVT